MAPCGMPATAWRHQSPGWATGGRLAMLHAGTGVGARAGSAARNRAPGGAAERAAGCPLTGDRCMKASALFCMLLITHGACASAPVPNAEPQPSPSRAAPPSASAGAPPARPADVGSIEAIIAALYDVISGGAGRERDWNRFRSLFTSGARLIVAAPSAEARVPSRHMTVEEYITF